MLHVIRSQSGQGRRSEPCLAEIRPMVWVSDILGSQRGHHRNRRSVPGTSAARCALCRRCGDTAFSAPRLKRLLLHELLPIGRRRNTLKDITLKHCLPASIAGSTASWQRFRWAKGRKLRKAHRLKPGAPVRVHHQSRRTLYQQRLRAPSLTPQRDLPQGDQWLPLRVGCRDLCRIPLSRQHRKGQLARFR